MDHRAKDNLTELLRYRALLLSKSTVVSHELESVTDQIAKLLSHPDHNHAHPAMPVPPLHQHAAMNLGDSSSKTAAN